MNLPNKLSLFRVFLVPVFLLVLYSEIELSVYIATAIFLLAAVTDMVDGYIARTRNMITDLGKFLDPLADKILVISAMVYLVAVQTIPDWMVIIIIAREFAVSGFRIIAASKGVVVAASNLGKYKTRAQIIAVIFALLKWSFYWWIVLLAVILTVLSGIDYMYKGKDLIKE
jgi:CDP-diacylglycerol--glycerol-3-phosphate 3-phosphatidyltransferase